MIHLKIKPFLAALAAVGTVLSLNAQIAQDPLLSRTATVEPNIVFMFDDSGSMPATAVYQFGGSTGGLGRTGPGDDTFTQMFSPPAEFHSRSPDVNLIYYDPRVTYSLRVNADGSFQAPGSAAAVSSFNVYFYKPATTTLYSVNNVTINAKGSGYPASGVIASFTAPPPGGVQATANVVTAASTTVSAVNMTNGGSGYAASGVTATFSAPAAGGVTATATVTVATVPTGAINTAVTINNSGTSNYSSVPTVTFSAPPAGGTRATGTAVMSGNGKRVVSITVTNAGAGYTTAPTIGITGGGGSGAQATATLATTRKVTAINVTNGGSGYTGTPTLTLGNTGGGTGATFSVVTGATNVVSAINVTNSGSGYTTQPTLTLTGAAGGTGLVTTVNYNSNVVAPVNKTWDGVGTPTTSASYFTPGYTPDAGSPLASGATSIAYPNTASSATANYPKFSNRTDCGATTCTWAQERQNYANWLKYHSTRMELAKTGIGLAFQPLNPTFRLGWATINTLDDSNRLDKGVRLFNSGVQGEFLTWLYGLSANGNTPNRIALDRVGKYYQRADSGGPWAKNPTGDRTISVSGTEAGHASCRRSYAMLMTDGYYNDSFTLADVDSSDGTAITVPSAYQYKPIGPYSDARAAATKYSNSFADVAMKYWVNDLRPDLDNRVRAISGDEAFWQHLNFYAIGLGITGTLDANDPSILQQLTGNDNTSPKRTLDWPTPASDSQRSIDDMWHATVNGRGRMLNAKTADELNRSILQMMSTIGGKENTQSGVAVSTASLKTNTKKYTPGYIPIVWGGNLTATNLDETSGAERGVAWQVEKETGTDPLTGAKTYDSLIPSANNRNIFVGNGNTSGTRAVPFTHASMSSAGLLTAMNGTVNAALIDFLRGDASNEAKSGTTFGIYRGRSTRLGDIVNSTPVFVKDTLDLNYQNLPGTVTGQSTYAAYIATKAARKEGVLFVGANDGMLHAFRDGTFDPVTNAVINQGGIEVFAYVPRALLPTLNQLADKTYVHRYYVDGPTIETDAYIATPSNSTPHWTNIVIGSTGAGAGAPSSSGVSPRSAIFAIDVTSINTSPNSLNASSVLWEIGSSNASFAEMGHVLTDVQAGTTPGGQWVGIFGNGYESRSCQARLFVVNLQDGSLIRELNTNTGNCTTSKNGLGGVKIVRNSNQQIVGVYGGDLLGNMWKFSLNDANPTNWKVDLGGAPLYKAGPTQPFTASPAVVTLSAATAPSTGYMVVAGTGKFFEVSDISTVDPQALYGFWDPLAFGAATIPAGTAMTTNALLVPQTISAGITGTNGNTYYEISKNAVSYTGAAPKRGWYTVLPNVGQRQVYPMELLLGRVGVADTISPSNISTDACEKPTSGSGFIYLFDALTGAGPTVAVLDTNGDGVVNTQDMIVSGLESSADGRNVTLKVTESQAETTFVNVSGGSPGGTLITISCIITNSCATGLTNKLKSREWRQLFMR